MKRMMYLHLGWHKEKKLVLHFHRAFEVAIIGQLNRRMNVISSFCREFLWKSFTQLRAASGLDKLPVSVEKGHDGAEAARKLP